jgi:hypothetical protein
MNKSDMEVWAILKARKVKPDGGYLNGWPVYSDRQAQSIRFESWFDRAIVDGIMPSEEEDD